jgi:hypothetical protein
MKGFNDMLESLGMSAGDANLYGMGMGGYGASSSANAHGHGHGQHGGKEEEYEDDGLEGLVRMGEDDGGKEEDGEY